MACLLCGVAVPMAELRCRNAGISSNNSSSSNHLGSSASSHSPYSSLAAKSTLSSSPLNPPSSSTPNSAVKCSTSNTGARRNSDNIKTSVINQAAGQHSSKTNSGGSSVGKDKNSGCSKSSRSSAYSNPSTVANNSLPPRKRKYSDFYSSVAEDSAASGNSLAAADTITLTQIPPEQISSPVTRKKAAIAAAAAAASSSSKSNTPKHKVTSEVESSFSEPQTPARNSRVTRRSLGAAPSKVPSETKVNTRRQSLRSPRTVTPPASSPSRRLTRQSLQPQVDFASDKQSSGTPISLKRRRAHSGKSLDTSSDQVILSF